MEKISAWVKEHPYATGALVIGGGIAFIVFSGWFSGGGSTTVASSGPSSAQIAAETQLQAAQLAAGVASSQSNNQLQVANLAASVQSQSNTISGQVALAQLQDQLSLGLAQIGAASTASQAQTQAQLVAAQLSAATVQHQIDAQTQQQNIAATNNVDLANIAATTNVSNLNTIKGLIEDLMPKAPVVQPAPPAPVPTPTPAATPILTPTPAATPIYQDSSGNLTAAGIASIEQLRPDVLAAASANPAHTIYDNINNWYNGGALAAGDAFRLPAA